MNKNKKIISVILLLFLVISLCSPFVVSAEESYALSGLWVIDKEIELPETTLYQEVKYTTKGSSSTFSFIQFNSGSIHIGDDRGATLAYSSSHWQDLRYRFIDFGDTPQSVSKDFYLYFTGIAKQRTLKPSDILDDLGKDSRFALEEYPDDPTDYSLNVVQIAESDSYDLYIYVYQPSNATRNYEARYINMSVQNPISKNLEYKLYSLTLVDTYGTLDKYKVNNFSVSADEDRYYNIASIYRFFDAEVDNVSDAVDSIQCKAYEVGQYWHTYYFNDEPCYESKEIDVVEIDIQVTGSIRYLEGFNLYYDACDSHYVAFSIKNYNVDQIFDADITYTLNCYKKTEFFYDTEDRLELAASEFHEKEYLSSKEIGSNDGGWLAKKYTWNRIQTVDDFISEVVEDTGESFTAEEYTALKKSQFVFRFSETSYTELLGDSFIIKTYSETENVGILRLHFISEGKYYNLGAVSDLVGTDSTPELEMSEEKMLTDWWDEYGDVVTAIVLLIILLLAAILIYIYARDLGVAILRGIADLFTLLISLVSLPIRLLASLLKKQE